MRSSTSRDTVDRLAGDFRRCRGDSSFSKNVAATGQTVSSARFIARSGVSEKHRRPIRRHGPVRATARSRFRPVGYDEAVAFGDDLRHLVVLRRNTPGTSRFCKSHPTRARKDAPTRALPAPDSASPARQSPLPLVAANAFDFTSVKSQK